MVVYKYPTVTANFLLLPKQQKNLFKIVGNTGADSLLIAYYNSPQTRNTVTSLPLVTVSAGRNEIPGHKNVRNQVVTRYIVTRTFQNIIVTNE